MNGARVQATPKRRPYGRKDDRDASTGSEVSGGALFFGAAKA